MLIKLYQKRQLIYAKNKRAIFDPLLLLLLSKVPLRASQRLQLQLSQWKPSFEDSDQ
jgi:hypothetical protein